MSDSLHALADDPGVPDGSIFVCDILVTEYIRPDGSLGTRTWFSGGVPLSQCIGLLALAERNLIERCER